MANSEDDSTPGSSPTDPLTSSTPTNVAPANRMPADPESANDIPPGYEHPGVAPPGDARPEEPRSDDGPDSQVELQTPGSPTSPEEAERTDAVTVQTVRREVRDFVRSHERRRQQFPRAALVGLLAGLVGTVFRMALLWIENWRTGTILSLHSRGAMFMLVPVLIGVAGGAAAVAMVQRIAPETAGSGIPHLKAVILHLRSMRWTRILPVKFIGGVAGIGAGLALGREGPTIQMGGAVGQMVAEMLRLNPRERQTLVAAGAGAGLSAAFNAPLSGMVFVLEEVQRDFTPTVFAAALVASVTSDVVTRLLTGQEPVFHLKGLEAPSLYLLPAFIVVGFLAGVAGVGYNRGLLASLDLFQKMKNWPLGAAGAVVGLLVGAIAWFLPGAVGGGYPLLSGVFAGSVTIPWILGYFCLRFGLTMFSYGCGAPGGIFAPLLVLGAILGLLVGKIEHILFPGIPLSATAFAVVGMGAYFSAIVRAPLTGIVLMLEMTAQYQLILPLLCACLLAYGLADALGDRPVYEALLERDLLRGQHVAELKETFLLDVQIHAGAPFEGKTVRELGLPPGCILVTIHRGIGEIVPVATTRLEAGDRVTAVIAPEAADGAFRLRHGAGQA